MMKMEKKDSRKEDHDDDDYHHVKHSRMLQDITGPPGASFEGQGYTHLTLLLKLNELLIFFYTLIWDNDLYRILFMPNGLSDGTELAYYARGKKVLDGYWLQAREWYILLPLWYRDQSFTV